MFDDPKVILGDFGGSMFSLKWNILRIYRRKSSFADFSAKKYILKISDIKKNISMFEFFQQVLKYLYKIIEHEYIRQFKMALTLFTFTEPTLSLTFMLSEY